MKFVSLYDTLKINYLNPERGRKHATGVGRREERTKLIT